VKNGPAPTYIGCKTRWRPEPVGLIAISSQNILYLVDFRCPTGHPWVRFETWIHARKYPGQVWADPRVENGPAPTLVECKTWWGPEPTGLIAIPTFITYKWFLSPFRAWSLIHATLVFADYFVTKCGVLLMSLFVFFTITMSISFTLRETQSRMLRFTGLCFFCQSWPGTAIA
jgi:hypothetical protein